MNSRKANFLLVLPRLVNRIGEGYNFPLGIPYISSSMKKAGLNVYCINLNHIEGNVDEIISEYVKKYDIDAVYVGGTSGQYYPVKVVVDAAHKITYKNIFILVGGGMITADPIPAMKALEWADIGVIGEGEITDVEVSFAFQEGKTFYDIDGVIFKEKDGRYIITNPRKEIGDLDEIAWPDYDGFSFEKTLDSNAAVAGVNALRSIAMLGSRSCPYSCTFCFHTVGRKYRQRSLNEFFKELEYNINKYDIKYLFVEDELFTYNNERVIEFCSRIKKYNIKWWAQFRVDSVDPQIIAIMKDAGCDNFALGLESADNKILKSMGKHITVEQIERTLSTVYEAKMASEGSFILGDENETYETAMNTLNWWRNHRQFRITLGTITVFPGSQLYKNAIKNGIIKDPVKHLQDGCPQLNITKMTDDEFADIVERVMKYPVEDKTEMKDISNVELEVGSARVSFDATCERCNGKHRYNNIKLFMHAPLSCMDCGKKYSFLLPSEFYSIVNNNINNLIRKYDKVAFWGVNYQTYDLVGAIEALKQEGSYLIDSSTVKQKLKICGCKVFSPDILKEEQIDIVVINIPTHFAEIELQIKYQYPHVKNVIDIGKLVEEIIT